MSDSSVRTGSPTTVTTRGSRPVGSRERVRRVPGPAARRVPGPAPRRERVPASSLDLVRAGAIAVVVLASVLALLLDRSLAEPVAHLGIIPQPGATTDALPAVELEVGSVAPNFVLKGIDGDLVELADLRGAPVVLQFGTSWCIACTAEMPGLQELADARRGQLHVLGIDVGEGRDRARTAAEDHGVTYPLLLDREEEVAHHYGFWSYPVTVVIDAEGTIVAIHGGPVSREELEADLPGEDPS